MTRGCGVALWKMADISGVCEYFNLPSYNHLYVQSISNSRRLTRPTSQRLPRSSARRKAQRHHRPDPWIPRHVSRLALPDPSLRETEISDHCARLHGLWQDSMPRLPFHILPSTILTTSSNIRATPPTSQTTASSPTPTPSPQSPATSTSPNSSSAATTGAARPSTASRNGTRRSSPQSSPSPRLTTLLPKPSRPRKPWRRASCQI